MAIKLMIIIEMQSYNLIKIKKLRFLFLTIVDEEHDTAPRRRWNSFFGGCAKRKPPKKSGNRRRKWRPNKNNYRLTLTGVLGLFFSSNFSRSSSALLYRKLSDSYCVSS